MKKRIVSALIMSTITTIIISFTIIAVNIGFVNNFLTIWMRSWCMSYVLAVMASLFIAPRVQSFVDHFLQNRQR